MEVSLSSREVHIAIGQTFPPPPRVVIALDQRPFPIKKILHRLISVVAPLHHHWTCVACVDRVILVHSKRRCVRVVREIRTEFMRRVKVSRGQSVAVLA